MGQSNTATKAEGVISHRCTCAPWTTIPLHAHILKRAGLCPLVTGCRIFHTYSQFKDQDTFLCLLPSCSETSRFLHPLPSAVAGPEIPL